MKLQALAIPLALCTGLTLLPAQNRGTAKPASTRIEDPKDVASEGRGRYPFRDQSDYILAELDIRDGDAVVDIGAGDGWWTERMAEFVGDDGVIYAAEVEKRLVDEMTEKFAGNSRIKPLLIPTDGTDLPENSVDLALFSQVYHHLDEDGRVDYLSHLKKVLRPTGRICVIERYTAIAGREGQHGTHISSLAKTAEESGWIMVRFELMPKTYHYVAFFAQKELFPAERRGRRRGR